MLRREVLSKIKVYFDNMKDLLNSDISAKKRQICVSKQEDICVETGRYLWANIMQIVWCPPHICQAISSCQMQEKRMGRTNIFLPASYFWSENTCLAK